MNIETLDNRERYDHHLGATPTPRDLALQEALELLELLKKQPEYVIHKSMWVGLLQRLVN